ncbi:MAG: hypothetical protein ACJ79K_03980 [Gemmatimonadaceae bacterium]
MNLIGIALFAQLAAPARPSLPVLEFPEAGIDDTASYRGYQTRFFRDAARNTVQLYLDRRDGRVVNLWADAEDESIGFTARDASGSPVPLRWASAGASTRRAGRLRTVEYDLVADAPRISLGWFLLGSMRVERDFQYANAQLAPFSAPRFSLPELDRMIAAMDRLPPAERTRELALVGAHSIAALRARMQPSIAVTSGGNAWTARITQSSLDGRDTMRLELSADPRRVIAERAGDSLSFRARAGAAVPFTVRIATTGRALTPLAREEIFNGEFLRFLAASKAQPDSAAALRARRMERQVRGVELLSSREKLMAGLPTYATYFGRDMLMTALMMRPIWRDEMSEFAIASALRKLGPRGDVSHEEALGGQAVRESASEYAMLVGRSLAASGAGRRADGDSLLRLARSTLRDMRRTRENYHMIDDEFQFVVLTARWLGDSSVTPARKRAFLLDTRDYGEPRLARLVRELGLVARLTTAYAADPVPSNLVSFPRRDSTWASSSWRDSGVGYAGGRYAMDINAIWAPHALAGIARIADALHSLGFSTDSLSRSMPDLAPAAPLGGWLRDRARLAGAIDAWRGAARHFIVRLAPAEVQSDVAARLAAMPAAERDYWSTLVARTGADRDSLVFLALALDANGRPIGVANSDPATRLFLGDVAAARAGGSTPDSASDSRRDVLRDVRLFVRPYPVGLLIAEVGPVVANDAYASPAVWGAFVRDPYHGPRVVWGREINLFLLGASNRLRMADGDDALARELRSAIDSVRAAVQASGFHSELWSYEVSGGKVVPARYGTSADVQLWSTTDLAVEFALSRLPR